MTLSTKKGYAKNCLIPSQTFTFHFFSPFLTQFLLLSLSRIRLSIKMKFLLLRCLCLMYGCAFWVSRAQNACFSESKFPKLFSFTTGNTQIFDVAMTSAQTDYYVAMMTDEIDWHGQTSPTTNQHLILKYGLLKSTDAPTWVRVITNSFKIAGTERHTQIVLNPNEDKLLVTWQTLLATSTASSAIAYLDTTTGNQIGSAMRIRSPTQPIVQMVLGLRSIVTFQDDAVLFAAAMNSSTNPFNLIGYLGFDGSSFSIRGTFSALRTTNPINRYIYPVVYQHLTDLTALAIDVQTRLPGQDYESRQLIFDADASTGLVLTSQYGGRHYKRRGKLRPFGPCCPYFVAGIFENLDYPETHIALQANPMSQLGTYEIPFDFRIHDFAIWFHPSTGQLETRFVATCLTQCTHKEYVVKYINLKMEMSPLYVFDGANQYFAGARIIAQIDNGSTLQTEFPLSGYVWGNTSGLSLSVTEQCTLDTNPQTHTISVSSNGGVLALITNDLTNSCHSFTVSVDIVPEQHTGAYQSIQTVEASQSETFTLETYTGFQFLSTSLQSATTQQIPGCLKPITLNPITPPLTDSVYPNVIKMTNFTPWSVTGNPGCLNLFDPHNSPTVEYPTTQTLSLSDPLYTLPQPTIKIEAQSGALAGTTQIATIFAYMSDHTCAKQDISIYVIDCDDVAISQIDFKSTAVVEPIVYLLESGNLSHDIQVTISNYEGCALYTQNFMQNPTIAWNSVASADMTVTEITNNSSPAMVKEFRMTLNMSNLSLLKPTPTLFKIEFSSQADHSVYIDQFTFLVDFIPPCWYGSFSQALWDNNLDTKSIQLHSKGHLVPEIATLLHAQYYAHCAPVVQIVTTLPSGFTTNISSTLTPLQVDFDIIYWQPTLVDPNVGQIWSIQIEVATYDHSYPGIAKTTLTYNVLLVNQCTLEQIDFSGFTYDQQLTRVLNPELLTIDGPPLTNHVRLLYPLISCGIYEYQLVYPYNPLNIPNFVNNFDASKGSFEIESVEDKDIGDHTFRLNVYFKNEQNFLSPNGFIDVQVRIDPCQVENFISPKTKPLISYMISNNKISEYFDDFVLEPACNYQLGYEAQFQNITVDTLITDLNIKKSTLTNSINLQFYTADPLVEGRHTLEFLAYLVKDIEIRSNPVSIAVDLLIPRNMTINEAPYFVDTSFLEVIQATPKEQFSVQVSESVDPERDEITLKINMGSAVKFIAFTPGENLIHRRLPITPMPVGSYQISITLTDLNPEKPASQTYQLQIIIMEDSSFETGIIEENSQEEKLVPMIEAFQNTGLVKINWNLDVEMSKNITQMKELIQQKITVFNERTGLMEEHEGVELRVYDQDSFDEIDLQVSLDERWVGLAEQQSQEQGRRLEAMPGFFTNERLRFQWNLTDFHEDGSIEIQLDFEQIYQISVTSIQPDYLEIVFWNTNLFRSKNGMAIDEDRNSIVLQIPQIVEKMNLDLAEVLAKLLSQAVGSIAGASYFINFILSTSMNQIWTMIHSIQLITHLPLLSVQQSPLAMVVYLKLNEVSKFDILDVEPFLRDNLNITEQRDKPYTNNFGELGYPSKSMLINFGQNSFLIAIIPLLYLVEYITRKIKSRKQWFNKAKRAFRVTLHWNLLFRLGFELSLMLMIMSILDVALCNLQDFGFGLSFVLSAILLILLSAIPLFVRFYILKRYNKLRTNYMSRRFGEIYHGLQLKNNPKSLLVMENFIWRRLIYAICMVLLEGKLYLQFQILIQSSVLTLGLILYYNVHQERTTALIETVNESCLVILIYHMMYFSDFVDDANFRYYVGFSCVLWTCLNIVFNVWMCAAFSTSQSCHSLRVYLNKQRIAKIIRKREEAREFIEKSKQLQIDMAKVDKELKEHRAKNPQIFQTVETRQAFLLQTINEECKHELENLSDITDDSERQEDFKGDIISGKQNAKNDPRLLKGKPQIVEADFQIRKSSQQSDNQKLNEIQEFSKIQEKVQNLPKKSENDDLFVFKGLQKKQKIQREELIIQARKNNNQVELKLKQNKKSVIQRNTQTLQIQEESRKSSSSSDSSSASTSSEDSVQESKVSYVIVRPKPNPESQPVPVKNSLRFKANETKNKETHKDKNFKKVEEIQAKKQQHKEIQDDKQNEQEVSKINENPKATIQDKDKEQKSTEIGFVNYLHLPYKPSIRHKR